MSSRLKEIFDDEQIVNKIRNRLPYLFQIAEIESSRAGKIGMEVGSVRERILVALLIYKFGKTNVETEIPVTEPEIDVKLFGDPISIKTITGRKLNGVKLVWTVDAQKAWEFRQNYRPLCDILLVQVNWGSQGGLYYIPLEAQQRVFGDLGRECYIKLPKPGTNPRGAEITPEALSRLVHDPESKCLMIYWQKRAAYFDPYQRWVDMWGRED